MDQKPDSGAVLKSMAQESSTGIFSPSLEYSGCCEQMVTASELDLSVSCTSNHMYSHRGLVWVFSSSSFSSADLFVCTQLFW